MKFDEIKGNENVLTELGEASERFLKEDIAGESFLDVRSLFYTRLIKTAAFVWLSIFFLLLSNVITLTKPTGSPYLSTQDGLIIPITEFKSVKR